MSLTIHDKLALVTVAEDTDWDGLARQASLGRYVIKALSPRAVLIDPAAVEALVAWLLKNGYLPRVVA